MPDPVILGIKEAAAVTPFSESTLYKAAKKGSAPFRKVEGRWVTTPEDLKEWVRGAQPMVRRDLMAEVVQLRKESV